MRIEKDSRGAVTRIRLIGHFQSEHVEELMREIQRGGPQVMLDLKELTLLDVHVVRLLGAFETGGATLVNCRQYVREWIDRERRVGGIG